MLSILLLLLVEQPTVVSGRDVCRVSEGEFARLTIACSSVNRPPTLAFIGSQNSPQDEQITLQLTATDPDGDVLSWQYLGLPPGLSGNDEGLVSGSVGTPGNYAVTVTVEDRVLSDRETFEWIVSEAQAAAACADGEDNDGDALVDFPSDPGCASPQDDDETDSATQVSIVYDEVSVQVAPADNDPFGVACADWDQDGFMECAISEHAGGKHTRWEWNGSSFEFKDELTIPGCDLAIYAVDANLDGNTDLFCEYINWPAAKYVPFSNGDLDTSLIVDSICGSGRLDNCAPVLNNGDLLTRRGERFAFDGNKAALVQTGFENGSGSYTTAASWFVGDTIVDLRPFLSEEGTVALKHTVTDDFDGDGDLDLLFSQALPQSVVEPPVLLLNEGGEYRADSTAFPDFGTSGYWHSYGNIDCADLDNDGDSDCVVFGGSTGDMYQIYENVSGTFSRVSTALDGSRAAESGKPAGRIIDFDGDGCLDLFVTQPTEETAARAYRNSACPR